MKKTLLISLFLFSGRIIFGQIQVAPILFDTLLDGLTLEVQFDSDIKNTGSSGIGIVWERTIFAMPQGWENYVCTGVNCYSPEQSLGSFNLIEGSSTQLLTHFNTNLIPGCAYVIITLTDLNNPAIVDTVTYKTCLETVSTENVNANSIVLYPNPTVDFFMIKGETSIAKVILSNIAGMQVKIFDSPVEKYDVGDLNDGMYIVQLLDSKNKVIKTSRLSVQKP